MKTIEISIKMKKKNMSTANLVIYQNMENYQKNPNKFGIDFDAASLYPSAINDEKSVYPKTETGFVFRMHMNDVFVEAFINQNFNQFSNESAIRKIK